ncbi:MAG: hypothetical protein ACQESR_04805 [Planctomycetota bacterium]
MQDKNMAGDGPMLGSTLTGTNLAVQKCAVPSGIVFCHVPISNHISTQVPARIVPKLAAIWPALGRTQSLGNWLLR